MPNVTITLEHYMSLVLRHHPFRIITKGDDTWNTIMSVPEAERQSYVVENEEWTMGFDTQPMSLSGVVNGYRVWYRKDWEICDNKRQEAVRRIDNAQKTYKANMKMMLEAIRQDMISKGITELVWGMLKPTLSDVQIKDMYNTLVKTTTK